MTEPTKLVEELDALFAKATKGIAYVNPHSGHASFSRVEFEEYGFQCRNEDAALIVALVNAWPQLRGMAADAERLKALEQAISDSAKLILARAVAIRLDAALAAGGSRG